MEKQEPQVQDKSPVKSLPTPVIGIIAWLVPGSGHWLRGEKNRAIAIFCGIMFLFIVGICAGGTALINYKEARLWYLAQIFAGLPSLIMTSKAEMGFGRGIDMGQLYTSCAGLLNLLCVIDAMIPTPKSEQPAQESSEGNA
jgi:hypothetical protein